MKRDRMVKSGSALLEAMNSHQCCKKSLVPHDLILIIGYRCEGCGWKVGLRLKDLKIEKDRLRSFWLAMGSSAGREWYGKALSKEEGA